MMPDEARDKETRRRLTRLSKGIRYVTTDPEMAEYCLPYFEKVFYTPQPIDLEDIVYQLPQKSSRPPVVMHIPTRREVKGTAYIEAAVERLHSEGFSLDFQVFKPLYTQKQVRKMIATADIYIDELRCGSYGMTAVEAMASGKPTITYIREDLLDKYPADLPLVNANPDTIYAKLKELVVDAELRREIGEKSRKYIEAYHTLEVIGPRLLQIYKDIGFKPE
jgi:glycosyltransferase involved in cell wall biosynthesis